MYRRNFFIELKPPIDPNNINKLYDKIKGLITKTGRVSLASKPFGKSIAGFELSHNLAKYLLERHPRLDILFHLTCYDVNRVNIRSRLALLKQLNIKRILVISGDGYEQSEEAELRALQFENSQKLATCILKHFDWFDFVGVAGYPGGNGKKSVDNFSEFQRLSEVLRSGANEIYTQCVFDPDTFVEFNRLIKLHFPQVRVVPSLALFESSSDIERIALLTRVHGTTSLRLLTERLNKMSAEESRAFATKYLLHTCSRLLDETDSIDLCTFGKFALAQHLIDSCAI